MKQMGRQTDPTPPSPALQVPFYALCAVCQFLNDAAIPVAKLEPLGPTDISRRLPLPSIHRRRDARYDTVERSLRLPLAPGARYDHSGHSRTVSLHHAAGNPRVAHIPCAHAHHTASDLRLLHAPLNLTPAPYHDIQEDTEN